MTLPGFTFPDFKLPQLATGGRATRGTLAVIGEGAEPESVLPDSVLRGLLERANRAGQEQSRGGPALVVQIDTVEAHDYQDFMQGMQRRRRQTSLAGFNLPGRGDRT